MNLLSARIGHAQQLKFPLGKAFVKYYSFQHVAKILPSWSLLKFQVLQFLFCIPDSFIPNIRFPFCLNRSLIVIGLRNPCPEFQIVQTRNPCLQPLSGSLAASSRLL